MFHALDISVVNQLLAGIVASWETGSWFASATDLEKQAAMFLFSGAVIIRTQEGLEILPAHRYLPRSFHPSLHCLSNSPVD